MKKIIFSITILFAMALAGCEKFTDIAPKGKNLLSTAEHLEMLLNYDYRRFGTTQTAALVNGAIPPVNFSTLRANPIKTTNHARIFWDTEVNQVELATSDGLYQEIYHIIGRICNPVILLADGVSGDRDLANRCKAEAYTLRAWFHYLAVNIYAKAYNPATAATDGGVAYVYQNELSDLITPVPKLTVAQVYRNILADLDSALALNALHNEGINRMRVGKAFTYAVQAQVYMSMHLHEDALVAARASLALNSHVDDHNTMLKEYPTRGSIQNPLLFWRPNNSSKEDLFATYMNVQNNAIPNEMFNLFDPNAVLRRYMPTSDSMGIFINPPPGVPVPPQSMGNALFGTSIRVWAAAPAQASFSGVGLTTVDMHLIEAECLLREDNISGALDKIELIRENRILTSAYTPSTASSRAEVLNLLKRMWRCENFFTYRDFINLKRWNTETEFAAPLTRMFTFAPAPGVVPPVPVVVNLTLPPNSPLWIFPFPQTATNLNPNLTQN